MIKVKGTSIVFSFWYGISRSYTTINIFPHYYLLIEFWSRGSYGNYPLYRLLMVMEIPVGYAVYISYRRVKKEGGECS